MPGLAPKYTVLRTAMAAIRWEDMEKFSCVHRTPRQQAELLFQGG